MKSRWGRGLKLPEAGKLPIRAKLAIACSCFMAGPLVLFLILTLGFISKHYEEALRFSAAQSFEQAFDFASTRMASLVKASDILYFAPGVQTVLTRDRDRFQNDIVQQNEDMNSLDRLLDDFRDNEDVYRVTLYVPGWAMYANQGIFFDNMDRLRSTALYSRLFLSKRKVLWEGEEKVISPDDASRQAEVFSMYRKIRSFSNLASVVGVMKFSILASHIQAILEKAKVSTQGLVFITDAGGRVIARTGDPKSEAEKLALAALTQAVDSESQSRWSTDRGGSADYFVLAKALPDCDWTLVSATPEGAFRYSSQGLRHVLLLLTLFIAATSLCVAAYFSRSATRRITSLTENMNSIRDKNLGEALAPGTQDEIGQLIDSYNYLRLRLQDLIEAQYQAGLSVRSAELRALQAQINPHFLYNALDLVNWKAIEKGVPEIAEISRALARFYYICLADGKDIVSLAEELGNVEAYMQIQSLRFENRIRYVVEVPEALKSYRMPKLILQPLVENAINHGIREREPDPSGCVEVRGRMVDGAIELEVVDDGLGMSRGKMDSLLIETPGSESHGYGLRSVNERIQLCYGLAYGLRFSARQGGGTAVTVRIPAIS